MAMLWLNRARQGNPPGERGENLITAEAQQRKGGKGVQSGDGGQQECDCRRGRTPAPWGHDGAGEKWQLRRINKDINSYCILRSSMCQVL